MWLLFLACSTSTSEAPEPSSASEDWSDLMAQASSEWADNPTSGAEMIAAIPDPFIRDLTWSQLAREHRCRECCERIEDASLQTDCKRPFRAPHLYDNLCDYTPARQTDCPDSCGDIPDGTCLHTRIEFSDFQAPEAHIEAVQAVAERGRNQVGFCHARARADCPCLSETFTAALTLDAGTVTSSEAGQTAFARCAASRMMRWRFPEALSGPLNFTISGFVEPQP